MNQNQKNCWAESNKIKLLENKLNHCYKSNHNIYIDMNSIEAYVISEYLLLHWSKNKNKLL